ncbi:MAG: protein kinase, partial [Cyanobacteria bacterium P01_G01_bin.19]
MVKSAQEQYSNPNQNSCYCFNHDCSAPQNNLDASTCKSCGSDLLLKNRYRALEVIGRGGFGRTFKGIDESQPALSYCAIKQFWVAGNSRHPEKAAELFEQEAQRLEVLGKHPQIPKLLDFFSESNHQYLIQEFVRGENLAEVEAWTETQIRKLLVDLLPLIQFVHNHKVIHRDIKPENIVRRESDGALF